MWNNRMLLTGLLLCVAVASGAQSAFNMISRNRNISASNYCIYPDSVEPPMTEAPRGKKPFYISHYGRHGSRYLSNRKGYDIPYRILTKADSLGKLTPTGKQVLQDLRMILNDSEGRWGDLTGLGKRQSRDIARRMMTHLSVQGRFVVYEPSRHVVAQEHGDTCDPGGL